MKPRYRAFAVLSAMAILVALAVVASTISVDVWWFSELGQVRVYRRMLGAELALGGATGVFVGLVLGGNTWLAMHRGAGQRCPRTAALIACIMVGGLLGWRATGRWPLLLLWLHRQRFGVVDPVHHRDIGFFVFTLPMLQWVAQQLVVVGLLCIVITAVIYRRAGALRLHPLHASATARVHVSLLGALLLVMLAGKVYLGTFTIELHQSGATDKQPFAGAHFVDVRATLPGLEVVTLLLVGGAAALVLAGLAGPRHPRGSRRTVRTLAVVLSAAIVLTQSSIPPVVQRVAVDPDPFAVERPFLARSIEATRAAFGLDRLEIHEQSTAGTAVNIRSAARSALGQVQLWDTSVVAGQMRQLASTTPYFRPAPPSLELLPEPGRGLGLLAERELDPGAVPLAGDGWVNKRLAYTHGFGAFQFSASAVGLQGDPTPVSGPAPLRQPRIYFGRLPSPSPSWVVADTRRPEVDPSDADYHYRGRGGIELSSWLRRAAFALQEHDSTLLLATEITPASRLMLHRDVVDRLRTLASFLTWDTHPIPVIASGRLMFVADGYTTTNYYPYAQHVTLGTTSTSYARAAVTASVDAYSGQVRMYAVDTTDPILRAWRAAFPVLFASLSAMPTALRAERRYPSDLFDTQAMLYRQFHMTDPAVFASQADAWDAPISLSGPVQTAGDIRFGGAGPGELRYLLKPSYRFAEPPGRRSRRLLRTALYCPFGAQNLAATLDGWIGPDGQPQLDSTRLTGQRVTPGPAQISRLVLLTPQVADVLDVRDRELRDLGRSSLNSLTLGSPHLMFLGGDEVQVQAVYDVASGGGIVRRRGVTVYLNRRAAIGATLDGAVRKVLSPRAAVTTRLAAHRAGPSR